MTKTLDDRLRDARSALDQVDAAIRRHPGSIYPELETFVRKIVGYSAEIDHWIGMLDARTAATRFLDGLEMRVDGEDRVSLGAIPVKFQHARLIGVQAYVTTTWALADSITGLVGRILCTVEKGSNEGVRPQLISHFVQREKAKKSTAAPLFYSLRETFGWPIGLSYSIRNHFVHDGAYVDGYDFFEGPTSASAFKISTDGWDRVVKRAESYGLDSSQHRGGTGWMTSPQDNLRTVFQQCDLEMDDALGVLVGSAFHLFKSHVGFLLGED